MREARDFDAEVRAVYPALLRSACTLCFSSSDVDDVVQETVLRAMRSYSSFTGGSSFLTWIYVILVRVAATANRQRARGAPEDAFTRGELPPVDAVLIEVEEGRRVIDAIRALPQRQREMVTLHFLEDLSYRQIAEALDVSVGTVKATMFSAKMSLRAALRPPEG